MKFASVADTTPAIASMNGAASFHGNTVSPITARRPSGDIETVDWDTMFVAVTETLRRSVGTGLLSNTPLRHTSIEAQGQVLQCVDALEQLRTAMLRQVERAHAHEAELRSALTAVTSDLANAHANELTARHQAAHDGLTSLPNRASFKARLADVLTQAAERDQSFALFYIDLDGFKAINDTYGHATGDQLLRIIAARLAGAVRAEDMVSRLGGDEFACLLWDAPPGRAALTRLAATIFDVVSAPFQLGSLPFTVRPSIGIALWPEDGLTADSLLDHADSAMYHAKRSQTGFAYFETGAEAQIPPTFVR